MFRSDLSTFKDAFSGYPLRRDALAAFETAYCRGQCSQTFARNLSQRATHHDAINGAGVVPTRPWHLNLVVPSPAQAV